ncbi:MAG: TetR family transcriptional regulator [Bdellovibrionaceae bacterium]|nr:TetR family transcriptional regulator [Pseudobdellovibrionaceae bacterium]
MTDTKKNDKVEAVDVVHAPEVAPSDLEGNARERLKEVAIRLFAQSGIDGVSTRDIAREANVNISLISYYFGGKEGLYKTAVLEYAQLAVGDLTQLMDSYHADSLNKADYMKLMRGIITGIIQFKLRSPQMSELMMREILAGLPHMREMYATLFNTVAIRIMDIFAVAQKKGIVRADVNGHTWLFAIMHSMDSYFFASKCGTPFTDKSYKIPEEKDLFIDQLMKIFVEGVMK